MKPRILYLFSEKHKELYRTLRTALTAHFKGAGHPPARPIWAVTEDQAWIYIEEEEDGFDLIIAHIHLPENSGKTTIESENRGLMFLQRLGEEQSVPSILLTPAIKDPISIAAGNLHQCTPLPIKMKELTELVIQQASQKLDIAAGSNSGRVKLDICINLEESRCEMIPIGADIENDGHPLPLQVDPDRIAKLLRSSMRVKAIRNEYPLWKEALEDIGDDLMKEIFRSKEAYAIFRGLRSKVGGLKNISIRFYVNRSMHPLILEALNEDSGGHRNFWMLKAPICRKYSVGIDKLRFMPLFEDEETRKKRLNCLVIEADVSGWADEIQKHLKPLDNIKKESATIQKLWKKFNGKRRLGKIDVLHEDVSADAVQAKLEDGTVWHIVHFAGHSFYVPDKDDPTQGTGFLAMQKDKDSKTRIQSVDIRLFSNWLRKAKTRFIYLSSCESSNDDFVYELASNSIPAVLGFRWDLDDPKAAEHVKHFYKHLFAIKSLEYAFLHTRQDMHGQYKEHNIWAAPMLMMQGRK